MKVLFLCYGNFYRSQIAAAYLRRFRPDIDSFSAGVSPRLLKKRPVDVVAMRGGIPWKCYAIAWEIGLELGKPKHWYEYEGQSFDFVIALSKKAFEQANFSDMIYVPVEDPMPWGERERFLETRDTIIELIDRMFGRRAGTYQTG